MCPGSVSNYGSSPQVRGTVRITLDVDPQNRFIPAGAGNIRKCVQDRSQTTVHPRRCGEQYPAFSIPSIQSGSSPQVRGTDSYYADIAFASRFIPAGAGNRSLYDPSSRMAAVHPRRCGEQKVYSRFGCSIIGSSPQVRGTELFAILQRMGDRFIPAGAGNRISH